MKYFPTTIRAMDPKTGEFCEWHGPCVPASSVEEAWDYCQKNGLGYCYVENRQVTRVLSQDPVTGSVSIQDLTIPQKN